MKRDTFVDFILYCIENKINISKVFRQEDGHMLLTEEYDEILSTVVPELYKKGVLIADYSLEDQRLLVNRAALNPSDSNEGFELVRNYFKVNYCGQAGLAGDKKRVYELLTNYLEENPNTTIDQIQAASKLYIDSSLKQGKYIRHLENFIMSPQGSMLSLFIEEIQEHPPMNHDIAI